MATDQVSPLFKCPLTDLTSGLWNHQVFGRCAKMEMNTMDCLEAYGVEIGKVKCADLMRDFDECQFSKIQLKRYMAMRAERERQIKAGILKGDDKYVNPRIDSF